MEQNTLSTISNWTAPASVLNLASSSWHVTQIQTVFQAGHHALTGHGDALDARVNVLPTGRTPGRALRAFRRKLQRDPIAFA
jgi:hypothetical protein